MKSQSETTNDEPIGNHVTAPPSVIFAHLHWYKL